MDNTEFFFGSDNSIRRVFFKDEWWYVVEDIVLSFVDTDDIGAYLLQLKVSDTEFNRWYMWNTVSLIISDKKGQKMSCVNLEGVFRLIQSINTSKAEPFKLWLASLGKKRIKELED